MWPLLKKKKWKSNWILTDQALPKAIINNNLQSPTRELSTQSKSGPREKANGGKGKQQNLKKVVLEIS